MYILLSPAKRQKIAPTTDVTPLLFLQQVKQLDKLLKTYAPWQLERDMKLSPALAVEVFALLQDFDIKQQNTPAILAFEGLAYTHLQANTLTPQQLRYAQDHLLILSGLYGALRPMDGIAPHRLEVGSKVKVNGQNLYRYWGNRVAKYLQQQGQVVCNLASKEYSKMVLPHLPSSVPVVQVRFFTKIHGKLTEQATYAKMARGELCRYIIQNQIDDPIDIVKFSPQGFGICPALCTGEELVYIRE